jgi:hypothetical protein
LELSSKKGKIKMLCYKGFDKDLKCQDFQYETGKKYSEESAEICEKGFHACEFPLDVFRYYAPSDSRYCEVDLDANDQKSNDSKRVGKSISIKAEIGIAGIVKAGVEYIKNQVDWNNDKKTNTGYCSAATNTGYRSAATNTGDCSAATNTGYCSAATNTGDCSAATNTGYRSAATNTGYCSAATNTGYRSAATNTGDCSAATNTGDCSAATNTGNCSAATVEGKESVAMAIGYGSKAKGSIGCFIVLAEWKKFEDETYHIVDVKSAKVDGTKIKPDTFYKLVNGEFVAEE